MNRASLQIYKNVNLATQSVYFAVSRTKNIAFVWWIRHVCKGMDFLNLLNEGNIFIFFSVKGQSF